MSTPLTARTGTDVAAVRSERAAGIPVGLYRRPEGRRAGQVPRLPAASYITGSMISCDGGMARSLLRLRHRRSPTDTPARPGSYRLHGSEHPGSGRRVGPGVCRDVRSQPVMNVWNSATSAPAVRGTGSGSARHPADQPCPTPSKEPHDLDCVGDQRRPSRHTTVAR